MESGSLAPRACSSSSTWDWSPLDLLGTQPAGEPRHDQSLEPEPDVEHVACLVPTRRRDRRASVASKLDEAFGGELPEHMADDRAARAEALADRILGKLGARRQRLLDDGVAQGAIDGANAIGAAVGGWAR